MPPIPKALPVYSLVLGALLLSSNPFSNAQQKPLLSPRDSTILYLEGKRIFVDYGRPSMRGRKIMGELVPWNKVWRTGANEATTFRIDTGLVIGPMSLFRKAHTLSGLCRRRMAGSSSSIKRQVSGEQTIARVRITHAST